MNEVQNQLLNRIKKIEDLLIALKEKCSDLHDEKITDAFAEIDNSISNIKAAELNDEEYHRLMSALQQINTIKTLFSHPDTKQMEAFENTVKTITSNLKEVIKNLYFASHVIAHFNNVETTLRNTKRHLMVHVAIIGQSITDNADARIKKQHEFVIDTYYKIRQSTHPESRFFDKRSGLEEPLGDALEKFIKTEMGVVMPHTVEKGEKAPSIDAFERVRLR
ncbi:hypothetical protein [Aquicella lusitana]|uniref:Uncharacterized protein n=1 Tax=Aquicella lusitana TaxID=254246 RepID=A0A370GY92_9COXI|nr:hypothetical protein [Aquicella lusitana]RDI48625.1 hypothetical protein C8D86_10253 [Aquicella lusitana]VVC73998.1 hypothetical protein AQULUS_17600 [Aquicella lusitana]